eukprot:Sspe_Gene.56865::Locus_31252_Transcript_1_1_Confidence_1.000_Length_1432::g.56865::m.56865
MTTPHILGSSNPPSMREWRAYLETKRVAKPARHHCSCCCPGCERDREDTEKETGKAVSPLALKITQLRCHATRGPVTMLHLLELGGTPADPLWPEVAAKALFKGSGPRLPYHVMSGSHSKATQRMARTFMSLLEEEERKEVLDRLHYPEDDHRVVVPRDVMLLLCAADWEGCEAEGLRYVDFALARGADPAVRDATGQCPLHYAVTHSRPVPDSLRMVERLAVGEALTAAGSNGATPLHIAASHSHPSVVQLLVDCGAPLSAVTSHGFTPLHLAVERDGDVVRELVDSLASQSNIDSTTDMGWTPLHVAARAVSLPAVAQLLAKGASPAVRNKRGHTPVQLVRFAAGTPSVLEGGCDRIHAILDLLETATADPRSWRT